MQEDVKAYTQKIISLFNEIKTQKEYKKELFLKLEKLDYEYKQEKYSYLEYKKIKDHILERKTKKYWKNYYDSCIYSLLKQIEYTNSKIFYYVYEDTSYLELKKRLTAPKKPMVAKKAKAPEITTPKPEIEPGIETPTKEEVKEIKEELEEEINLHRLEDPKSTSKIKQKNIFSTLFGLFFKKHKKKSRKLEKEKLSKPSFFESFKPKPKLKELPIFLEEKGKKKEPKKKTEKVEFESIIKPFLKLPFLKGVRKRFKDYETTKADKTDIGSSILDLSLSKDQKISARYGTISRAMLEKEAKKIQKRIRKEEKLKIYKPSLLGSVSNFSMRGLSMFLVETFPEFFKHLYHAIRLANIKLLSNTYINIMVMLTIISGIVSMLFFSLILYLGGNPFGLALTKSAFIAPMIAIASFFLAYFYPFSKVKARRKNINTNLSFALDNMAAISSSGVPPIVMFRLISQAEEYGDVSEEIEKVVDYTDVFGYDLLTAIRIVSNTTPNPALKEVFEGFVTTIESGGKLDSYLKEEAKEATLAYQLKRRRYTETVATYSDIYTGLLIAAPLFFVATITLMSMLGGAVGGVDSAKIIVLGTYVVIPLLNTLFLVFLEITQPEI